MRFGTQQIMFPIVGFDDIPRNNNPIQFAYLIIIITRDTQTDNEAWCVELRDKSLHAG
jgi:hypothetical protein